MSDYTTTKEKVLSVISKFADYSIQMVMLGGLSGKLSMPPEYWSGIWSDALTSAISEILAAQ